MNSEKARNAWVAAGDPLVTWCADLTAVRAAPRLLAEWLAAVLAAGRTERVYTVHEAPAADYLRERDGELEDVLTRRWEDGGPLDLFAFAGTGTRTLDGHRLRVSAELAYVDPTGTIVEDELDDVGALLASLRPDDALSAGSLITPTPPLHASGVLLAHDGAAGPLRVLLSAYTDIWLPWVTGLLEDDYDPDHPFDNGPLARRHTPRLNAFLGNMRDHTRTVGGTWSLVPHLTRVDSSLFDGDGLIRLDAPPPTVADQAP